MKERPAAPSLGNLLASPDLWAAEMPLIPRRTVWYLPRYRDASFPPAESRLNERQNLKCLVSSCRLLSLLWFFLRGSGQSPPRWLNGSRCSRSFLPTDFSPSLCADLPADVIWTADEGFPRSRHHRVTTQTQNLALSC